MVNCGMNTEEEQVISGNFEDDESVKVEVTYLGGGGSHLHRRNGSSGKNSF